MSAQELRAAAALMRSRAERCAAIFGGVFTVIGDDDGWPFTLRNGEQVLATGLDRSDAEHIAAWHPTVALAVADLLDGMALSMSHPSGGASTVREERSALVVARTYLGGAS